MKNQEKFNPVLTPCLIRIWGYNHSIRNQPPDLVNPGDQTITEGQTISPKFVATDPDNDPITYSFTSTLTGATISGNTFSWTPGPGSAGTYSVKFNVTDSGGLSDEETIRITVNAPITNVPTKVKIVPKAINLGSKGYFLSFVTLTVQGELKNKGTTYTFTGSDDVKVISKPTWQPDDFKDVSKVSDDQLFKKYST